MARQKLLIASAVILMSCGAVAQTAATPPQAPPAPPALAAATNTALIRLGGQLMLAGKAYEYDRVLADEIGPRLTGSANYVKAADWAFSEFNRMGLSNVHRESWEIDSTWEPETWADGRILVPHEQKLHLESDGWSPSTPEGGVRGNVVHLDKASPDGAKAQAAQIKDAIVLIDDNSFEKNPVFLWGGISDTVNLIASEGAKAILLGIGATNNVPDMAGLSCCNGDIAPLPVGNVGEEDTLLLKRLMQHGDVEVEFSFRNRIRQHVKVDTIIAEIPGSEPDAGFVLLGGHLDSWHLGTGAEDNGTGAASVLAVAEAIKASGIQPRRTMRFALFGGEEQFLLGSIHYVRAHAVEMDKCAGVFITDTGSEPPKGWYVFGREDEKQSLAPIKPLLDALGGGETTDEGRFTFDTDNGALMPYGVPAFVLWTPMEKYMLLHHKPSDTFDKVNQRDLNLGAAVFGVTALGIADAPQATPHLTKSEVDEQLKKIKQDEVYQDLVTHHIF